MRDSQKQSDWRAYSVVLRARIYRLFNAEQRFDADFVLMAELLSQFLLDLLQCTLTALALLRSVRVSTTP